MNPPQLLASTGSEVANSLLRGIIHLFETVYPAQVRGYYVTGSYADGAAVATSDLDMKVVFNRDLSTEEMEKAHDLCWACEWMSSLETDISVVSEGEMFKNGPMSLKLGSLHVYGEDIRDQIPLPPIEEYVRRNMHGPYHFFARNRRELKVLTFPLGPPRPDEEFYGYDQRPMRSKDGIEKPGIKELVVGTGWAMTAIVAYKTRQFVTKKSDCLKLYKEYIHDEWTPLLEEIYQKCRNEWAYLVPESPQDRERLKEMCRQAPGFENHFLSIYKEFLLEELKSAGDPDKLLAIQRLGQIVYPDSNVIEALQTVSDSQNKEIAQAARDTLAHYAPISGPIR